MDAPRVVVPTAATGRDEEEGREREEAERARVKVVEAGEEPEKGSRFDVSDLVGDILA